MTKRILLALTLAASLGGAVMACNTPASTTTPVGSTTPVSSAPAESAPAESMPAESAAPSAS
jgi:hypothetical protein